MGQSLQLQCIETEAAGKRLPAKLALEERSAPSLSSDTIRGFAFELI